MPVARIYTRFPEEASALAERLRARGYTIELVDPGDFRVTPADLEIQLDRLKTGEAMAAAARFARTHDAEVFVSPGVALDEAALRAAKQGAAERGNVLVDGIKKLFAPFRRAGAQAHATRAARRQAKLDVELAREAERKRKAEEKIARDREQREKDELWASEREIVLARQREEEARQTAEREVVAVEERRRAEEFRQREEEERRQHAEAAARLAAEQAEQRRVAEEQARAEREREAAIAARVAEQKRLAEEERKAEEARKTEEEREQKRRAAAEVAAVEASKREGETRAARVAAAGAAAPAVAAAQPVMARLQQQRQRQNARVMWRATVAAAIVAGVIAVAWGAYENRAPAHPLSNSDLVHSQAIHQDVPFGPASINAQQPQAPPTTTATVRPPQTPAQAKPAPVAPAKASPAQGGKPAPRRHARRFKASPHDVDVVAEDQVIYHGAPKHSTGQASAQQPQVKHYSDMSDGAPQ